MAASIRDLLDALESEARYAAGTERQSLDAATALDEFGRALHRLARDGLELTVNGPREDLVQDLAESCMANALTIDRDPSGRLASLASGVADVVGILGYEIGRDERWAIAVEIGDAIRVLTTYAAEGEDRRTADLPGRI